MLYSIFSPGCSLYIQYLNIASWISPRLNIFQTSNSSFLLSFHLTLKQQQTDPLPEIPASINPPRYVNRGIILDISFPSPLIESITKSHPFFSLHCVSNPSTSLYSHGFYSRLSATSYHSLLMSTFVPISLSKPWTE